MTIGAVRQHESILEERPSGHGIAGIDVFSHGMLHEAMWCDQRDFAAADIGLIDQTADAAKVIGMRMGDHHCHDGSLAEFFVDELKCGPGGFL
ncbi:hypothetical protein D3C80_1905490 [compost metagenome]